MKIVAARVVGPRLLDVYPGFDIEHEGKYGLILVEDEATSLKLLINASWPIIYLRCVDRSLAVAIVTGRGPIVDPFDPPRSSRHYPWHSPPFIVLSSNNELMIQVDCLITYDAIALDRLVVPRVQEGLCFSCP